MDGVTERVKSLNGDRLLREAAAAYRAFSRHHAIQFSVMDGYTSVHIKPLPGVARFGGGACIEGTNEIAAMRAIVQAYRYLSPRQKI